MGNKVVFLDWGEITHRSIFSWYSRLPKKRKVEANEEGEIKLYICSGCGEPITVGEEYITFFKFKYHTNCYDKLPEKKKPFVPHSTYIALVSIISSLKRVRLTKEDKIIIAVDSYVGNWRKEIDPCLPPNTEVLTEKGWMLLKDIVENKIKVKIATRNNRGHVEYHYPTKYFKYFHNGKMIRFKGKRFNILCTPNHNNLFMKKGSEKEIIDSSMQTPEKNILFLRDFKYHQKNKIKYWIIPKLKTETTTKRSSFQTQKTIFEYKERKININDWIVFFAWYITEGCTMVRYNSNNRNKISISQSKLRNYKNCKTIEQILKKIKLTYSISKRNNGMLSFDISDTQLASYLAKFGLSGNKYIPRKLLNGMSSSQCKTMLKNMILGDGTQRRQGFYCYTTKSKQLAYDVMELALKAGYSTNISKKYIKNKSLFYFVYINDITKGEVSKKIEYYKGYTYDIEISNHVFFIKQNGKTCWTGNCYKANRKDYRESKQEIDWKQQYGYFNNLLDTLDIATPFYVVGAEKCESDDVMAVGVQYFKDKEVILITSDKDMEQLTIYPNCKIISARTMEYKAIANPYKILAGKLIKETTDNLITPLENENDFDKREMLIDLIHLPDFIVKRIEQSFIKSFESKTIHDESFLPYPSIKKKFPEIWNSNKILDYEKSIKPRKKRKSKKNKKSNPVIVKEEFSDKEYVYENPEDYKPNKQEEVLDGS